MAQDMDTNRVNTTSNEDLEDRLYAALLMLAATQREDQAVCRNHDTPLAQTSMSTAAEVAETKIVEYTATSEFDSHWHESTEEFLLHRREQFGRLEEMLPTTQHRDSVVKKGMLEAAAQPNLELQMAKDITKSSVADVGNALDYDLHSTISTSAAQHDDQVKLSITSNKHVAQNTDTVFPDDLKGDWHQLEHTVPSDCHIDHGTGQQLSNRCMQQQVMFSKSDTRSKQVILPCKSFEKLSDDVKPIVQGPHSPQQVNELITHLHDIITVYSQDDKREITASRKILAVETMEKRGERLDNHENVNVNHADSLLQPKNNRSTKQHDICTVYPLVYKKGDAQAGVSGTVETMESDTKMQEIHQNANRNLVVLLAHHTKWKTTPSKHDVRSAFSTYHALRTPCTQSPRKAIPTTLETMLLHGKHNVHRITYDAASNETTSPFQVSAAADRGAIGDLAGSDIRLVVLSSDKYRDPPLVDNDLPSETFCRAQESLAAKTLRFLHVYMRDNPADIPCKYYGYLQLLSQVPLLSFWVESPLQHNSG
jgi:hypothetical protein